MMITASFRCALPFVFAFVANGVSAKEIVPLSQVQPQRIGLFPDLEPMVAPPTSKACTASSFMISIPAADLDNGRPKWGYLVSLIGSVNEIYWLDGTETMFERTALPRNGRGIKVSIFRSQPSTSGKFAYVKHARPQFEYNNNFAPPVCR